MANELHGWTCPTCGTGRGECDVGHGTFGCSGHGGVAFVATTATPCKASHRDHIFIPQTDGCFACLRCGSRVRLVADAVA
jgi:hypothetical protein